MFLNTPPQFSHVKFVGYKRYMYKIGILSL